MVDSGSLKFVSQAPTQGNIDKTYIFEGPFPIGLDVTSAAMTCFFGKTEHRPRAAGSSAKPAEPPTLGQGHSHRWALRTPGRQQLWHPPAHLD